MPSPTVLATISPKAPFQFFLLWVKLKEHYCLPLTLAWAPNQIFLLWFFSNASPQRVSCHFRKLDQTPTLGFISNLKPISSCVGVQISEALTPTPNLHGKCTVTPPSSPTALAFGVRCFLVHPELLTPLPANPQPAIRGQTRASYL